MLDRFVRLHDGPDTDILNFARQWGVFELCHHNLPYQHGHKPLWSKSLLRIPDFMTAIAIRERCSIKWKSRQHAIFHRYYGVETEGCFRLNWEPVETWRFFSRQAHALLNIAANVHLGKIGPNDDWRTVLKSGFPGGCTGGDALRMSKDLLLEALNVWLEIGTIQLSLENISGRTQLIGADLFGSIALQLMLVVTRRTGFVQCSHCQEEYDPIRRPSKGRNNYCNKADCQREGARLRTAKSRVLLKRKRRRQKAATCESSIS
jgi:hypothetical protein